MRIRLLILIAAAAIAWPVIGQGHPATVAVDWIWSYLGGKDQYEKARYVEFTWASENEGRKGATRKHLWDRYSGDYVLEFDDSRSGESLKIYFNIETKKGVVVKSGTIIEGDEAAQLIDRAYEIFVNDTYWLLVPTKLGDYGTRIQFEGHEGVRPEDESHRIWHDSAMKAYLGKGQEHEHPPEKEVGDESYDASLILHVWFDPGTGLTPGDQYWIYLKHDGRIDKWRYQLESGEENEWTWSDEKDCGMGLTFSTRRTSSDGKRTIFFPEVKFSETMDRGVFSYQG